MLRAVREGNTAMHRTIGLLIVISLSAWAEEADAGVEASLPPPAVVVPPPPPPPVDAGVPATGYDAVTSPWGPGRKSSGEAFRSMAKALPAGPTRWTWGPVSLAIGGQYFARGELRDGNDFNAAAGDHTFGLDQRARLSVRASAFERVGVLVELQDVRAWGSEPNTVTVTPNTGLHQGFVDLRATDWLDVRVGRQELSYGEDRLIGNLDWAQTARAFDGVFARATVSPKFTLDAFGMLLKPPAWVTPDGGGARFHNSGTVFTGLYARTRLEKSGFDVYALGLFDDPATAATGRMKDSNRVTLGARGFVGWGGLAVVAEGAFQTGKVGPREELLLAGAFAAKATYTFSAVWGAPYVGAEFSGASGDGDATDGVEHGFNQLFPTGHIHLGYMDLVGWQNVVAGHGVVGFRPGGAHVWLDVHHFGAWDPKGAWYAANGSVFLAADATRTAGTMGTELDFNVTVPVFQNFALAGNFSVFLPGNEASARGTSPATWGFLSVRSQF